MGASLLVLAQVSWPQLLAKIDLSQQRPPRWLRCGMRLVNLRSSIAVKEIFESVWLLQNDFRVYATLFQSVHLLRCRQDLLRKF
jgi:hypothetical protein